MIIAIVPLVPIIAVTAALAGIAAWLAGRKKKPPTTTGELPPPPKDGDAPFFRIDAPYIGKAERAGAGWSWSTGELSGSAPSAMAAIGDLLSALAEREDSDPQDVPGPEFSARGAIGGGGNPTLQWSTRSVDQIPGVAPGTLQWRLEEPATVVPGKMPIPPIMLAEGRVSSGAEAIAILAAAAAHIDWLMIAQAAAAPAVKDFHGLVISGKSVAVTDLSKWVAYAGPKLIEIVDVAGGDAAAAFDALVGAPPDGLVSGKTREQAIAMTQRVIDSMVAGTYMSPAPPDLAAAAALVGVTPQVLGEVMAYKGRVILVQPQVTKDWRWAIFEKQRGLDADAIGSGSAPTKPAAIRRGRFFIDNGGA